MASWQMVRPLLVQMPRQMWQQKLEMVTLHVHLAARTGHLAVVQWLVQDAKADVAAVTGKGDTALHFGHLMATWQWSSGWCRMPRQMWQQ